MNTIPDTVRIHRNVQIGEGCVIGGYTIIGFPIESEESSESQNIITLIDNECIVGSHVVIYRGSQIGRGTKIEDFCRIGENVTIGRNCYILYAAKIYDKTKIGDDAVIAGFVCERAKIGSNVRLFGELLHSHREPHLGWDDVVEESPVVNDCVFIGFGAKVIGGIKIGRNSYITAGAIVTKDVPPKSIAFSINNIIPFKEWKGKLRQSRFFERCLK